MMNSKRVLPLTLLLMWFLTGCADDKAPAVQQNPIQADFDQTIETALEEFSIPGVAVGVVQNGEVLYLKGFGYRNQNRQQPVDGDTLFAFGSTTKAMTATLLGMLVDKKKLSFDKPVTDYLPNFRLSSEEATAKTTVGDLLSHQVGIPRHDLVWYGTPFTRDDIFNRLRFLPLADPKPNWLYSNLMYMTAGMIAERIEGQSWENLIRNRLFLPLGMGRTTTSILEMQATANAAKPFVFDGKELVEIPYRSLQSIGPAGSVNSSVREMLSWVRFNLEHGLFDGKTVLSMKTLNEIHRPRLEINSEKKISYGYGWVIGDFEGELMISHDGSVDGFHALVTLFPKRNTGVVVVCNRAIAFPEYVARLLYDRALGKAPRDWMQNFRDDLKNTPKPKTPEKPDIPDPNPPLAADAYVGVYQHPGYGAFEVVVRGTSLYLNRYQLHSQAIEHIEDNVFWYPGLTTDSRVTFKTDGSGAITRAEMNLPGSPSKLVFLKMP